MKERSGWYYRGVRWVGGSSVLWGVINMDSSFSFEWIGKSLQTGHRGRGNSFFQTSLPMLRGSQALTSFQITVHSLPTTLEGSGTVGSYPCWGSEGHDPDYIRHWWTPIQSTGPSSYVYLITAACLQYWYLGGWRGRHREVPLTVSWLGSVEVVHTMTLWEEGRPLAFHTLKNTIIPLQPKV